MPMLYVIGQPHPVLAERAPLAEGMVASIFDETPCLTMIVDRPTPAEVRAFRREKAHLGLMRLAPHGYVWLLRLGDVLYFEAPVAPMLEHPDFRKLITLEPNLHMPMQIHMIDPAGTLLAMRMFTLTPSFAAYLREVHDGALAAGSDFGRPAWERTVTDYQTRFSDPKQAFAKADAMTFGGIKKDPSVQR